MNDHAFCASAPRLESLCSFCSLQCPFKPEDNPKLPCLFSGDDDSALYHPNRDQRRWVLLGRSRRETEVDVFTSTTARNEEIAGNPHRPRGFGRNGIVFIVVSSSQCRRIYSSPPRRVVTLLPPGIQRRLARTLAPIRVVQATDILRNCFEGGFHAASPSSWLGIRRRFCCVLLDPGRGVERPIVHC